MEKRKPTKNTLLLHVHPSIQSKVHCLRLSAALDNAHTTPNPRVCVCVCLAEVRVQFLLCVNPVSEHMADCMFFRHNILNAIKYNGALTNFHSYAYSFTFQYTHKYIYIYLSLSFAHINSSQVLRNVN